MQGQLTTIAGEIHPVTLLGRWIDRAGGRDDAEQKREKRQRALQGRRAGMYADGPAQRREIPGTPAPPRTAVVCSTTASSTRCGSARMEGAPARLHGRQGALARHAGAAQQNTIWSLGSFYVGEERVTADLAPFLLAAPSGEVELFLATQLVDEARHAAFFDRFGAEVMALSADDLRGRMREVEETLTSPWREVFDDGLRDVAHRIRARPDDLELFVEGIDLPHGRRGLPGGDRPDDDPRLHAARAVPRVLRGLRPRGARRAPAHRLRRALPPRRDRAEPLVPRHRRAGGDGLAPRAAHVFVPPYVDDAREFVSYGYNSSQIYGYAYRTLKRRMKVLGLEIPPPEELMPGPISEPARHRSPLRQTAAGRRRPRRRLGRPA